jgi:hypothetical protein
MSKKKGGKKGKKKGQQQLDGEPVQEQFQSDAAQGETSQQAAQPVLSDAVAEVIGDKQDKADGKKLKKLKSQIAMFAADGYDVSALEGMVETAGQDEIVRAIEEFQAGIKAIEAVKSEMQGLDFTGFEQEAEALKATLSNPLNHAQAAASLKGIKQKRRAREIGATLDKMVLPSMKARVDALRAMLTGNADIEAVETEFSSLKIDYKAAYAEEGVKAQIVSADAEPARANGQRPKAPMEVRDIFLLYKNGKFISHHRETPMAKEQQQALMSDLKTGRNFLLSPKYTPKKLNVIPVENRYILVQSGAYTVIICIVGGSVDPFTETIISKVINLMENEDQAQLVNWNGDVSSLKSCNKYMLALLQTLKKLNERRKGA